jgi:hypothetical protein
MGIKYALLLSGSGGVHRRHQTSDGLPGTLVEGVGAIAGDALGGDRELVGQRCAFSPNPAICDQ